MKDEKRTKAELIKELKTLRKEREKIALNDLTEHKQAEEALRASEEQYFTLFNNANDLIQIVNPAGKILVVNKKWLVTLEYSQEDVKGLRVTDIIREDKIPQLSGLLQRVTGGKSISFETVFISKSGKEINVEGSGNGIFKDDKFISMVGIFRGITKRKQAEEQLKDSEERLKILFDYAPDAYYINDLKGKFIDGNKAAERVIGYKREELIGNSFLKLKLLSTNDILKAAKLLAKNLRRLPTGPDEFVLNRKDNSKVTVEISTYPVKIKGRTLTLGIARDITERKQVEEALRESEEKFYSISSSAHDAIFFIDNDANIIYCNKAAEKMFGYSEEEMLNKELHKLIVPAKYYGQHKKGFTAFQKTGKGPAVGKTLELSAIRKNREEFPVALSLSAVKLKGKWNAIGIIRDISQQKKVEEKLVRIDSLTGCYSRRYGLELLDRQIKLSYRSKSPLLLAFLDIDRFKAINDTFGHDEGDNVLKEVVELFKSTLREVDIICRMGGDEFLLIFTSSSLKEAPLIKERLNKNLTKLNQTLKKSYKIGLSIGLSCYDPENPQSTDELIRVADEKMYEEKRKKK